jgi:hypothetical protein
MPIRNHEACREPPRYGSLICADRLYGGGLAADERAANSVRTELVQEGRGVMQRETLLDPARLSNNELLARVERLAQGERDATAALLIHLAELDARRLYLGEGYPSLFAYCTSVLHLSEHAAYGRIEAARTGRRFPAVFKMLQEGAITFTTTCMLAAHLTQGNHQRLLAAARHKSKRRVEELIAQWRPRPAVPATVRKLPAPRWAAPPPASVDTGGGVPMAGAARGGETDLPSPVLPLMRSVPAHPAVVAPLAPDRYRIQFTASLETCDKLRQAQDLLRHQIPDGDPAKIFDRALRALIEQLARQKLAAANHPRGGRSIAPGSRHVPADVRRAVWVRDGGRCAFVATNGRRCEAQGFLEFHHVTPHAAGGAPTVENIQLRCRAHNSYEAELRFGPRPTAAALDAGAHT